MVAAYTSLLIALDPQLEMAQSKKGKRLHVRQGASIALVQLVYISRRRRQCFAQTSSAFMSVFASRSNAPLGVDRR